MSANGIRFIVLAMAAFGFLCVAWEMLGRVDGPREDNSAQSEPAKNEITIHHGMSEWAFPLLALSAPLLGLICFSQRLLVRGQVAYQDNAVILEWGVPLLVITTMLILGISAFVTQNNLERDQGIWLFLSLIPFFAARIRR